MKDCGCQEPHERRRVVLTGGPGAGKTAVLELVRQSLCKHLWIVPESAGILFGGGFPRGGAVIQRRAAQRAIYFVQRELEESVATEDLAIAQEHRGVGVHAGCLELALHEVDRALCSATSIEAVASREAASEQDAGSLGQYAQVLTQRLLHEPQNGGLARARSAGEDQDAWQRPREVVGFGRELVHQVGEDGEFAVAADDPLLTGTGGAHEGVPEERTAAGIALGGRSAPADESRKSDGVRSPIMS